MCELLLAQSGHGIDFGGAARRSVASEKSRGQKDGGNGEEGTDVDGADIVEQATKGFADEVNAGKSYGHADQGRGHAFTDQLPKDVRRAGAEGNANPHFVIALRHGKGHHAVNADGGEKQRKPGKTSEDNQGKAIAYEGTR